MYSVTRLLDVVEVDRDRVLTTARAAAAATGARHQLVAPTLPGVRNGGDILMHLRFNGEDQWRSVETDFAAMLTDPSITRVNGACYSGTASCSGAEAGTVYRSLLLRVDPAADTDIVGRFEDELRLMPRYVNTITAWQLSRVDDPVGTTPWTHVFEQEFTDVGGLMGPYLMHPIHWAVIDRWFDPECPDVVVRDRVCHSFCHCETTVLR
ncbi:Dabb family protein [Mycobacterium sp. NPDC048908]|uniref:Dabb family protein n=1 Tax=Mycobacterium sp. NPDC048908 TaxID=3364292 RepID=UPI00371F9379